MVLEADIEKIFNEWGWKWGSFRCQI